MSKNLWQLIGLKERRLSLLLPLLLNTTPAISLRVEEININFLIIN
jgi:hypothetical protein